MDVPEHNFNGIHDIYMEIRRRMPCTKSTWRVGSLICFIFLSKLLYLLDTFYFISPLLISRPLLLTSYCSPPLIVRLFSYLRNLLYIQSKHRCHYACTYQGRYRYLGPYSRCHVFWSLIVFLDSSRAGERGKGDMGQGFGVLLRVPNSSRAGRGCVA